MQLHDNVEKERAQNNAPLQHAFPSLVLACSSCVLSTSKSDGSCGPPAWQEAASSPTRLLAASRFLSPITTLDRVFARSSGQPALEG